MKRWPGCTALIDGGKLSKDKLATAYSHRCLVHTQRMASDLAIDDCTQSLAIDANDAVTYAQRGEAYCQKGDVEKCVADFDQAMRIDPDDPSFTYLRGVARADAGDADGAIADLTKAIEKDPGSGSAYVRRGQHLRGRRGQGARRGRLPECAQDRPVRRDGKAAPRSLQQ